MYTGINEGDWYPLLENLEKKTEMLFGPGWTSFWEGVGANWNGFWEDRGEDAYDLLDGAWEDIKWAAKKDWENIKGGFSDWNRFWQDKGEKLFDLLDGAWEDIKRAAKKDWENIKEGFSDWNSFWQDKGEKLYDVLNPDDIGEAGGSAMSAIATAIDDGIPEVTESMNKALSLGEEFAVQFMNIYNDAVPQYQQMANGISIAAGMGMSTVGINYVSYTAKGRRINAYANGGFPDYGELFIANENGPELVGQIGSRTAVANQGQITDAIYMAVLDAMRMSGKNTSQGQGDVHVYIDSDEVSARVEQRQYARSKRLGG